MIKIKERAKPLLTYEQALAVLDATNHHAINTSKDRKIRFEYMPMKLANDWAWHYLMKNYRSEYSEQHWQENTNDGRQI